MRRKAKGQLSPQQRTYFWIRFRVKTFHNQAEEIEAFGREYGYSEDYKYLLNLAKEYAEIAQAA